MFFKKVKRYRTLHSGTRTAEKLFTVSILSSEIPSSIEPYDEFEFDPDVTAKLGKYENLGEGGRESKKIPVNQESA